MCNSSNIQDTFDASIICEDCKIGEEDLVFDNHDYVQRNLRCGFANVSDLFLNVIEKEIFANVAFDEKDYCANHFHVIQNKIEGTTINNYAMCVHIIIKDNADGLSLTFPTYNATLANPNIVLFERGSNERLVFMLDYAWCATVNGLEVGITRGHDNQLACWALRPEICQQTQTGFAVHGIHSIVARISAHVCKL